MYGKEKMQGADFFLVDCSHFVSITFFFLRACYHASKWNMLAEIVVLKMCHCNATMCCILNDVFQMPVSNAKQTMHALMIALFSAVHG